ncbi:MAG: hypothetical protein EOM85_02965 [Candidatus Moranbacteria bacterium]|nr:hypothetical protein [Candidatus Moranbacteria bacterium]
MRSLRFYTNKILDEIMIDQFLNETGGGLDFGKSIVKMYPELNKTRGSVSQKKKQREIHSFVEKYYCSRNKEIKKLSSTIKKEWGKKEANFIKITKSIFKGYDFPGGKYIAYSSIINCNPRFLDQKTFQFFYKKEVDDAIHTIAHELLHFVFFDFVNKKLKKEISVLSEDQLWDLSEIFNVVILRSPDYKNIINKKFVKPYPDHKKYIPEFENIKNRTGNIQDFIRQGIVTLKKEDK